jgi:hypothetical protein
MSVSVEKLVAEALQLPCDSRTELVEAILEASSGSPDFISRQMGVVTARIENLRKGESATVPATEAHLLVRQSLAGS